MPLDMTASVGAPDLLYFPASKGELGAVRGGCRWSRGRSRSRGWCALTAALATTSALAATTTLATATPAAHLGAELLHLRLLVGSQDLHDRVTTLLAIRYGGANLLNLLLLVGGQPQLGIHLLHTRCPTATLATAAPPSIASAVLTLIAAT
jgi:hypothetical protein